MPTIRFNLPKEIDDALVAAAKAQGKTITAFVLECVEGFLAQGAGRVPCGA